MFIRKTNLLFVMLASMIYGCGNHQAALDKFHFISMEAGETNINFNNKITESDSVNFYYNEYMYNGSGVGIGDFNNDGLADIFFGGSMVSSKLYINKGNFKFEDITEKAGLQTNQWCTGVSIVDINADGFMDIYVCSSHSAEPGKRKNMLFINDGKLHFSEQANAYGLADTGFSTQAAFFDYDKDGDIDMYLLNHRLYNRNPNNLVRKDTTGNSPAQDCLYRNDGIVAGQSHPVFTNVSKDAGIKEDGYGLGLVITDVNNDNWPDVYVANDYLGNDLLWLNNKNGNFSNIISKSIQHQSFNSMGVDAADINNDGLTDIGVLDMSPENNERKKMMFNGSSQERYEMERAMGYEPAFVRNMLQLNNGLRKINEHSEPFYSEIGQLAGISETDWSWSILMADFDNDGFKDIHITNGLGKDLTNTDYVAFKNAQNQSEYSFSGEKKNNVAADKKEVQLLRDNLDKYGSIKVNNYFFHNNGDLTFQNTTENTGLASPSVSNGAAYADLDNDGDLDLVVNNMNQQAFIWRNELRQSIDDSLQNFIAVKFKGDAGNPAGLGCKVSLFNKNKMQFLEQSPVRGFSSGMDQRLHFGVGNELLIDSLKIVWPDDKVQLLQKIKANQMLTIKYEDAIEVNQQSNEVDTSTIFKDLAERMKIDFKHTESKYFDFGFQRAVPQKYSQLGPCLATGDVNGDGLIDFFVGGAAYQSGKIFIQNKLGDFTSSALVQGMKNEEDLGAILFDSDGDKDLDLLITGGSLEFGVNSSSNQPRLYNNNGKGNFVLNTNALPKINDITKTVTTADYDGDGDMDLFIGGRLLPQKYPASPRSFILQNDHGKFKDVTNEICPALEFAGLITGAIFTDFNNDKKADLLICGEWMPVKFFANIDGKFKEVTNETGLKNMNGQWRSLEAADIDGDGDMDFIAGNMGLNNKFHITPERPLKLYAGDFDGNNSTDLIPAYYIKNNDGQYDLFPALDRNQLADQLPSVKKKYLLNIDYAKTGMKALLDYIHAKDMVEKECQTTSSIWIENLNNGKFEAHALPMEAQFSPVNAIIADDLDGDGIKDLLLAGNEYQAEVVSGQYDASYGLFLKGNGKGQFAAVSPVQSGFLIAGDVKSMVKINGKKGKIILAAVNDAAIKCFSIK